MIDTLTLLDLAYYLAWVAFIVAFAYGVIVG